MELQTRWVAKRLDEPGEPMSDLGTGMLEIDGALRVAGGHAGLTDGFFLSADEPWSMGAFRRFWDAEQWTCEVFERLRAPGRKGFHEPLPRLLEEVPGILFIRLIALVPEFRGKGLGREVLRRWLADWCDMRIGAVVIDAAPLQRRNNAYERYNDEVRDLPWEGPEEDADHLMGHLRGWGFHRLARTRYMAASPAWIDEEAFADNWPPVPIDEEDAEDFEDPGEQDIPF